MAPVINLGDVPHDKDMYWANSKDIPYKKKKDLELYIRKFVQDKAWWDKWRNRCINGMVVHNAVDFSQRGDIFIDGVTMVVNPDGSRYIPHLDYTVLANGDIWLPGRMCLYLNFWKMAIEDKLAHSKTFDHPWFTDLSWENWMLRERGRKEFKDTFWGKTRQRAISNEEACDSAWVWLFMNFVQVAITAGVDIYNDNTFLMIKEGVKDMANTAFFKTIGYDNDDKFTTEHTGIEIYNRTANGNPEVLNGLNRIFKAIIEEIGIMPEGLASEILKNVRRSIKTAGSRRTGYVTMIGTSGKKDEKGKLTVNNLADIEKFLYNPVENGLLEMDNVFDKKTDDDKKKIACFIPAWKFRIMDDNGNSQKQASIESHSEEISLMSKKDQAAFKQIEPMETTDMFNIIPGGFFGDYISDKCNRARNIILTHKYKDVVERGFLHYKNPMSPIDGVYWESDQEEGDIFIVAGEHPRKKTVTLAGGKTTEEIIEGLYLQGSDSYDFNEANTSNSKLCTLVFKLVDPTKSIASPDMGIMNNLVAGYIGRPTEAQGGRNTAYENAAKLSLYYSVLNMIEFTKLLIFEFYEAYGLEGFLSPRPDLVIAANIDRSQASNKYGMPQGLIPSMLTKLRDWLLVPGNIENIPFEFVLKAISEFKRAKHFNCDITMTMVTIMAQLEEYLIDLQENTNKDTRPQQTFKGFRNVGGQLQEVYA
jgi:hypothetical protein